MTSDQNCSLLVMNTVEISLSGSLNILLESSSLPFLATGVLKTATEKYFGSNPTFTIFACN